MNVLLVFLMNKLPFWSLYMIMLHLGQSYVVLSLIKSTRLAIPIALRLGESIVECFLFLLIVIHCIHLVRPIQRLKRNIQVLYRQKLEDILLPDGVYNITQLNCLGVKFENLLFNRQRCYFIRRLTFRGVLSGDMNDRLLQLEVMKNKKWQCYQIKNPFFIMQANERILNALLQLYEIPVSGKGYYFYRLNRLMIAMENSSTQSLYLSENEMADLINKLAKEKDQRFKYQNESFLHKLAYFIISMRYIEYLRGFYESLSVQHKVSLASFLKSDSKQLLGFLVERTAITIERIDKFQVEHKSYQFGGMKMIQNHLFTELNEWAKIYPELEFTSFNEEALLFFEGFQLGQAIEKNRIAYPEESNV